MSKLERWLTLVANLSVVAGIVFLAAQMRQNTQAIQSQTRDSITGKVMEHVGWRATSPELATAFGKFQDFGRDSLSHGEILQWSALVVGEMLSGRTPSTSTKRVYLARASSRPAGSVGGAE